MRLLDKVIGQRPSSEAAKPLLTAFRMASLVVRKHLVLAAEKCGWKPQNAEQRATSYVVTNRVKKAEAEGEAALKPLMWTLNSLLRSNSSLASQSDTRLARELIQCLGRMKDRRTVPFLIERLAECKEGWDYSGEIVDALAAIGDDRLVVPCVEILRDSQRKNSVRRAIASALGRFGLSQSNPAIVEALRELAAEPDPDLAAAGFEALFDFGDPAAIKNLLKHDHPLQRRKALVVLHRQANEQQLREVALDHSSIMTRAEACQFLSHEGLKSLAAADSTIGKVALALVSLWSNSIGMSFRRLPDPEYPISMGIFSVTNEQYRCFDWVRSQRMAMSGDG
jgi:HEAT repeat protein